MLTDKEFDGMMEDAGFHIEDMGGNTLAWMRDLPEGTVCLITRDDASEVYGLARDPSWSMGFYVHGQEVARVDNITLHDALARQADYAS